MRGRPFARALAAAVGVLLPLALAQVVTAAPAPDASVQVRTVFYDASGAGEFRTTINNAAAVWNSKVTSVRLVAGSPSTVRVLVDNGWPRTYYSGLGRGTFYMGRQAVNQGYYPLRIATHEFGHILGLPDRRTGLCSDLMSGSSAPVSCTNANPSPAEAAQVQQNFGGFAVAEDPDGQTWVWDPAA